MTRKHLRMVLRLRTSGATLQVEDSHRQHTRASRASYLSQPWCERGLGGKKERRGSGRWQRTQLQYLLVLWWYMFLHIRKACHQKHPGDFHNLLLHHQTATHEEKVDFRPRQHGQQGSAAGNTGSSRQFDGNCTSTLKQVVHRLIKWLWRWRRPQGAAAGWYRTCSTTVLPWTWQPVPGVGPCYLAYLSTTIGGSTVHPGPVQLLKAPFLALWTSAFHSLIWSGDPPLLHSQHQNIA